MGFGGDKELLAKVYVPKSGGRLGVRSLKQFNTAMLAKQGW